jgi:hypothetical protein
MSGSDQAPPLQGLRHSQILILFVIPANAGIQIPKYDQDVGLTG